MVLVSESVFQTIGMRNGARSLVSIRSSIRRAAPPTQLGFFFLRDANYMDKSFPIEFVIERSFPTFFTGDLLFFGTCWDYLFAAFCAHQTAKVDVFNYVSLGRVKNNYTMNRIFVTAIIFARGCLRRCF